MILTLPGGRALPAAMLDELRASYATPPRAYHHFGHIEAVLGHYAEVADTCGWTRPLEVYLAVLYHDAIYCVGAVGAVGAVDNEERSAALARLAIERHLDALAVDITEVERLVRLTALHGRVDAAGLDADTAQFLDCDMAILGAAAEVFDDYERAIALEYAALPIEAFRAGRQGFLERLLLRPSIFLSPWGRTRFESAARGNIERVLGRRG